MEPKVLKMSPSITATAAKSITPLCVDLDGTLVKSDTLVDSIFALVRQNPWAAFKLPVWLLRGKAGFKAEIGERVLLSAETLPYNQPLLEYIRAEHAAGRRIYMATASEQRLAESIAKYLGLFSGVIATDGGQNLAGRAKLDAIRSSSRSNRSHTSGTRRRTKCC